MCLLALAYRVHPDYPFLLCANRDEFYKRETKKAHYWDDAPNVLAGRDMVGMGTWMGVTEGGRFAALTNYRDPHESKTNKRSRGDVVKQFLTEQQSAEEYAMILRQTKAEFQGYNALFGDLSNLYYYSNVSDDIQKLERGIYGLSNHLLNTNWPKVEQLTSDLQTCVQRQEINTECLFHALSNSEKAADHLLPDTGVGLELEKKLSSIFIHSPAYGTRSSTVIMMNEKNVTFIERTFENGQQTGEQHFLINLRTNR
jgi:uncharacterized protein with NRDE domain